MKKLKKSLLSLLMHKKAKKSKQIKIHDFSNDTTFNYLFLNSKILTLHFKDIPNTEYFQYYKIRDLNLFIFLNNNYRGNYFMDSQKKVFLSTEGDQWYLRNKQSYELNKKDVVVQSLQSIELVPGKVLEIGCANGNRLNIINEVFGSECFGLDPSKSAIEEGRNKFHKIRLQVGTADDLPFEDKKFDMIIFGFCLYLCDPKDLFKIAYEADRCLSDGGFIVIKDFCPPFPYKNKYSHKEGVFSYKMNYSKMFAWNPSYNEIFNTVFSHSGYALRDIPDEKVAISILIKKEQYAFPVEPYKETK
jgi:ubiquinone/menaquinone biosynthesis C-methylase UbiE